MVEQKVVEGNIVIKLPDGFFEISEADLKEKNILIKPEYMFTNKEEVYVVIETKGKKTEDFIGNLKNIYTVTERITPGFVGLGMAKKKVNGTEMGAIQYKSNTVTNNLYNIMMICNFNDKQIMISGHCPWSDYAKWRPEFFKIFETVEERSELEYKALN